MRHSYKDHATEYGWFPVVWSRPYYYHWSKFTCIIGNYFVSEEKKHLIAGNDSSIFIFYSPSSSIGLNKYAMYFCFLWLLQDKIAF